MSKKRPPTRDRHRKPSPANWTDPRLAMISYDDVTVACSCGWDYYHPREKIRENAIDRHLNKRHEGRGIRFPA